MKFYLGPLGTVSFVLLIVCIVFNATTSIGFLIRRDSNKRADFFFALLLLVFALTCVHHVFVLQGLYIRNPEFLFLPVYFTLSLGAAFFFSVKLRLFPKYKFDGNDSKHLILPLGQFLYFAGLFLFASVALRQEIGRKFYSPFYGGLEMAFYIATFHTYIFSAHRYIRFRMGMLRHEKSGMAVQETLLLGKMVKAMAILFWINSLYIVGDFVMYELLRLNMHDFRGFTRFGELSFAAMAFWVGWIGWKLLTRQPYKSLTMTLFLLLKKLLIMVKVFLNRRKSGQKISK